MLVLGLFNISEILQKITSALALNIESYLKLHMLMPLQRTKVQIRLPLIVCLKAHIPTFEVEIKGTLEITVELHLTMQMVVHLLVESSAQNDSIKAEREEALVDTIEDALCCT